MAEKSYEKILVHDISCKNSIGGKPMCIRYDKINGFVRVYTGSKYLLLCRPSHVQQDWISYGSENLYYLCHFLLLCKIVK